MTFWSNNILVVSLIAKPNVSISPSEIHIKSGGSVNITCSAAGNPPPQVYWNVTLNSTYDVHTSAGGASVLAINDVEAWDSGSLGCYAENAVSREEANATLVVDCKFDIIEAIH